MASFMHVSYTLVFYQSKFISAMRRSHVYTLAKHILFTVATYIRLNFSCICVFLVTAVHV